MTGIAQAQGRLRGLVARGLPWLRMASEYAVAHLATRALTAASAFLLIRALPIAEYGRYTLLLSGMSFVAAFSDLGSTEALGYLRRRSLQTSLSWARAYAEVLRFRRSLFVVGLVVAAGYLWHTGSSIETPPATLLGGFALMAAAAWFAVYAAVSAYAVKLEQRFRAAYVAEIAAELTKVAGAIGIWALALGTADAAIATTAAGFLAASAVTSHALRHLRVPIRARARARQIVRAQVLPVLPNALYYALQGVVATWLAATFGTATTLAEVGAVTRVGSLITLFAGFTSAVFVPRLIAIQDARAFARRYLVWWVLAGLTTFALMGLVLAAPQVLLALLGEQYAGLRVELAVAAAGAIVSSWVGFAWQVNRARGWVAGQNRALVINVVAQAALLPLVDFSTSRGVLLFGLGSTVANFLGQLQLNVSGFWRAQRR